MSKESGVSKGSIKGIAKSIKTPSLKESVCLSLEVMIVCAVCSAVTSLLNLCIQSLISLVLG